MYWTRFLFGSRETNLRTPLIGSLIVSFVLAIGYLTGVLGSASFVSWGFPGLPIVTTLTAIILSAGIAYYRGGFILGLVGSCLVFLSTATVTVFFEYVGFTFSERVGFLIDLNFLIVSWGCLFGCIGYVSGVLLRRYFHPNNQSEKR